MITNFKIFENLILDDITINVEGIDNDIIKDMVEKLSMVIQKRIKRNLRILKISGSMNQASIKGNDKKENTKLTIIMTNKDKLEIIFTSHILDEIGELKLKINDDLVYDIRKKELTINTLVDKVVEEYKKYLKNNRWKI